MIKFGIVGLGRIGKIHLSTVQHYCPDAQVIAASPVKPKHQTFLKENGVTLHFETFEEMVQHPSIDAVIIASPTAFHYEHILLAAQAGKHIFCEKPIDLAYNKVKTVKATVAAAGIHFMVGFNRRFDPHIQQLKAAIDKGKTGSPRIVKITSRDPAPPPLEFIKHSGGIFLDMAIHDFDMARYLLDDEVVQVSSTGNIFGDLPLAQYDDIDTAVTTLIFKKGCMVQIDNSRYSAYGYDQRLEVFGESGMVATQNILEDAVQITDESGHHTARSKHFFVERYSDSYRNILMDFIATLKNKQAPSISADDGLAALVIAMAAKQSAKENRPISLS
jgi:myo-inositol 2-dehydrogenase/D-chiro-inositol 1-dehydrogenase